MARNVLACGLALFVGTLLWPHSQAQAGQNFIYLVSHRDHKGQLVIPSSKPAQESPVIKKTVLPSLPKSYSFRNTQWGMNLFDVKENERANFSWELHSPILATGEDRLGYQTTIEGREAFIHYIFSNHRLVEAKYLFESQHVDESEYLHDFQVLKKWVTQAYGPPNTDEELWLDDLYRYAPDLWGKAISRGHLTLVAEWEVKGTSIVLLLNGGGDSIGLMADFTTKQIPPPPQMVKASPPSFDW